MMMVESVTDTCLTASFFQDNLGKQYQKCRTILNFNEARDYWMAVASAGQYANNLNFTPANHASTSTLKFLQARCSS